MSARTTELQHARESTSAVRAVSPSVLPACTDTRALLGRAPTRETRGFSCANPKVVRLLKKALVGHSQELFQGFGEGLKAAQLGPFPKPRNCGGFRSSAKVACQLCAKFVEAQHW